MLVAVAMAYALVHWRGTNRCATAVGIDLRDGCRAKVGALQHQLR